MTTPKKRPAKAPERRTVAFKLAGEYEGWEATAYVDFKAKILGELNSDDIGVIAAALSKVVIDHNFPDADDPEKVAASMGDVSSEALGKVVEAYSEALGQLPPR